MTAREPDGRRFADVGGHRIGYTVSGAGPGLLLLHPAGLDLTYWDGYAARFAATHRVIAVDLRGHGRSDPIRGGIELAGFAQDVAAVLRREEVGPVEVIGVSLGGMVAQHLAVADPDLVSSLVLCSTGGALKDEVRPVVAERGTPALRDGMSAVLGPTIERWFSPAGRDAEIGRRCAATLLADDVESWAAVWQAISRLDTLGALPGVRVPALVVTGDQDTSMTPAMAREMAEALPDARLEIVEGAWHLGAFEDEEHFMALFARFLGTPEGD